ncbi:MAG: hypothetical protein NZ516_12620 [Raineya sp.]|nr:hypothetical protein [Raineya sp.]
MQDTPEHIRQKQFEIIAQKSNAEKLKMTMEMIELSLQMAYDLIKRQNPHFSHREIIAHRFEMLYKDCFNEEELQRIKKFLLSVE